MLGALAASSRVDAAPGEVAGEVVQQRCAGSPLGADCAAGPGSTWMSCPQAVGPRPEGAAHHPGTT